MSDNQQRSQISISTSFAIPRPILATIGFLLSSGFGCNSTPTYETKLVPAGSFEMGCTPSEGTVCYDHEKVLHKVTISRPFLMMESEVTQALFESIMERNPSEFKGKQQPVERVNWVDAARFANALSQKDGLDTCYDVDWEAATWTNLDCTGWRLPTEAEWEFAAKGGQGFQYAGAEDVDSVSWFDGNSSDKTHDVCTKARNGYGLCDMSGNVSEWVWDWYAEYSTDAVSDPRGPETGTTRVYRGGSWFGEGRDHRVASRKYVEPLVSYHLLGFRLVRLAPSKVQ